MAAKGPPVKRASAELTPREHQVLARYTEGQNARSISADLGIAEKTVREYIDRARAFFRETGVEVSTKIALRDAYQRYTAKR